MPRIESYSFGKINIDGKTYTTDVIVGPQGVQPDWWRKQGHSLFPEDLDSVMQQKPHTLIIGSGDSGLLTVPQTTKKWIQNKGVELIVLPTEEACQKYNQLAGQKKTVAGLHLTC